MYYHFAILLLFRPLIKLRIIGSAILPRDVCAQAADAIQGLLRSYSQLYTLRRTPSFVPYFVLTSSIMHLAVGAEASKGQPKSPEEESNPSTVKPEDAEAEHSLSRVSSGNRDQPEPTSPSSTITAKLSPRVAESLSLGIAHLTEMAPCHHFAHQALNILQYLAKKWNIEVDIPPSSGVSTEIDSSVRPTTSSLNFFAPNVNEDDFLCAWGARDIGGPGGAPQQSQQSQSQSQPQQQQQQRPHSGGSGKSPDSPTQTRFSRGDKMEGIVSSSTRDDDSAASRGAKSLRGAVAEQDPLPSFGPRPG